MITVGRGVASGCGGVNRRDFLLAGGMGLGALGLPLSATSLSGSPTPRNEKALILLMLVGGPSQLETWDPKPDAPEEVRGPFRSIATRVPGVRINEHLPRLAARMDKLALIRSLHHDEAPIHETGLQLLQTGRLSRSEEVHPHIGSVVSRLKGSIGSTPPFMMVPGAIQNTGVVVPRGQTAGWLGAAHAPFQNATLNVEGEPERLLQAYGPSSFGRSCLLARRLVESGVRVVTVNMFDTVFDKITWDCHGSGPFSTLDDYQRQLLPTFDQAFSALLDDLGSRGMLESTLVAAVGEFGRTPRINGAGGRDHWPGVWSVALAGGGVRGGQVIGASDPHAAAPIDRPVAPQELLASMYHALDVDPSQLLNESASEIPTPAADFSPVYELFS
ncbi:MAG: DUF1501 domain-containing protein [Paludisphaera borealis]|uniref:DUF1501 domain-containing protein n=1 Tax=Paludisphaera borealis TaxID=1387353 RepID=UPI0028513938|nr:DUF1501 domain-containing protein [Paludisphaera borealis]MDR3618617.1 DUF1501 domain-containing protein [Paludisphaera borealis]